MDISRILDGIAKLFQAGSKACIADGTWSHINPALGLPKICGNANDLNLISHG